MLTTNDKSDYIIVLHMWFVNSIAWKQKTVTNMTEREVKAEAALFKQENTSDFVKGSTYIIKVEHD